jgi:four helix bundle protein
MTPTFDHDRMRVYLVAREFNAALHLLLETVPSGRSDLLDQIRRGSASVVLNIAEGSGEYVWKEKARFYRMARRSGTECAAVLDLLLDAGLIRWEDLTRPRSLLAEVVSMLVKMVQGLEQADQGKGSRAGARVKGHV